MKPDSLETIFELSSMQKGVLFHSLYAPESSVYVNQSVFTIEGRLNVRALELAWQRVTERHQVLRCSFFWEGLSKPVQAVHRKVVLPVAQMDWRNLSTGEQETSLEQFLAKDRAQPFDLRRPPQMRLALICTGEQQHRLVWTRHHILFDGWSQGLLLKEAFLLYEVFCYGEDIEFDEVALAGPRVRFDSFVQWLQQRDPAAGEGFWRRHLSGFRRASKICTRSGHAGGTTSQKELGLPVNSDLIARLSEFGKGESLTLSTLEQAVWALVTAFFSGSNDVVFGLTVSGRPAEIPGIEFMIGLFINTLPVRAVVNESSTFREFARGLQEQQMRMHEHQHAPLADIQRWSEVREDGNLFDSIVVIGNYPVEFVELESRSSLRVTGVRGLVQNSLPLTLRVMPGATTRVSLLYDETLIDAGRVSVLLDSFVRLLEMIPVGAARPLGDFLKELGRIEQFRCRAALDENIKLLTGLRLRARRSS